MCRVCKHSHFSPWAGTLCGSVRWELKGKHWREVVCDCRGPRADQTTSKAGLKGE